MTPPTTEALLDGLRETYVDPRPPRPHPPVDMPLLWEGDQA